MPTIDSPSAYCYQPDPRFDACYINWYYLSVGASPNYMIWMEVTLNAIGVINHVQGFFQASMYLPYDAMGDGFRVACGAPGAGGNPDLGYAHAYAVRAQDSAALKSANYGTAYCQPFLAANAAPVITVSPASLTSDQAPGADVQLPLTITSDAAFDLPWTVAPTGAGCTGRGAAWVGIGAATGVTEAMDATEAMTTFSSVGVNPGIYAGHLCVASGDTVTPAIDVPLTMKVHNSAYSRCYASSTVSLTSENVSSTTTEEACLEIGAGPAVNVLGTGDFTLRAGHRVVLRNGFEVRNGGVFTAALDPALAAP